MIKKYYGTIMLATIGIVPVGLWLARVGLSSVTSSTGSIIASSGKAVALAGIALYAITPVLSMRHPAITALFGGLDKTYYLHSRNGKNVFYLIILHPILLGIGRWINGRGFTTVWDWSSLLVLSGIVALAIFVFVTAVSVYSHIKHQNWIWIHRLFGWLVPAFFLHALVARSQIVHNKLLLVYMLTIGTIGFAAFMYRSVFSRFLIKRYRYVVSEVNHFTEQVIEIVLKPTAIPLSFTPGQFAYLAFEGAGIDPEAHPFSFANSNNGPYLRFAIKALGDDTKKMRDIKPGAKAFLEGPYGNFDYKRVNNHNQVWIAGGIGITPFLSMARSFSGKAEYDIRFFYGTETLEEAVFLQEFIDITRHLPDNFKTTVVAKKTSGYVNIDLLKKSLDGKLTQFDFMICGPPPMMKALEGQLKQAGIPSTHVHMESFSI